VEGHIVSETCGDGGPEGKEQDRPRTHGRFALVIADFRRLDVEEEWRNAVLVVLLQEANNRLLDGVGDARTIMPDQGDFPAFL
jgi:hypothetical protein